MTGEVASFSVRYAVFESGLRMPFLLRDDSDFPTVLATRYVVHRLSKRRDPSTIAQHLQSIGWFYGWATSRTDPFDPDLRLATPAPLSRHEVSSFATYLRARRQHDVIQLRDRIAPSRRRREHTVSNAAFNAYLGHVRQFVRWAFDTQSRPILNNHDLERCDRFFGGELLAEPRAPHRHGLTQDQQAKLREVCDPKCPRNPFNAQTRVRNHAIINLLLEVPLRRSEMLKLRLEDVVLTGAPGEQVVKVVVRPDDPDDPRRIEPRQKTLGRDIPISARLKSILAAYLRTHSGDSPYFFLSSRGDGQPMAISAVNDVFEVVRNAFPDDFPDLFPHILRHTWNDNFVLFNEGRHEGKLDPVKLEMTQNYLNGWKDSSEMARHYQRGAIQRLANKQLAMLHAR